MDNIDIRTILKQAQSQVWPVVKQYLPQSEPEAHYEMVGDYPQRKGKYFRAALVLLACELYGGDVSKALLPAAALQLSEEWLLVHDDIVDHSYERRSTKDECKLTLNQKHGYELALNAGDALHVLMWQAVGDIVKQLGPELGQNIYQTFVKVMLKTIEGQYLELSWRREQKIDITEVDYYDMITRKTAWYSMILPVQLGAMVAGVSSPEVLADIIKWSKSFGYAFQIWDDVMNVTVASDKQGKELGGDINEGKRTLLLVHLLKQANDKDRQQILDIYRKPINKKDSKDIEYIINCMQRYGSIDFAKTVAKDWARQSEELFDQQTANLPNGIVKSQIKAGIRFVVNRDR